MASRTQFYKGARTPPDAGVRTRCNYDDSIFRRTHASTIKRLLETKPQHHDDRDALIARNTVITLLGTIGKAAAPLYLALATRLYGIDVFGIFATAQVFCEMGMSFLTAGFNDAALMHAATVPADRTSNADAPAHPASGSGGHPDGTTAATHALATALAWVLVLCVVVLFPLAITSPWLLAPFFDYSDALARSLQFMALGIPLFGLSRMMVAATVGHHDMRYDAAVNGVARPFGLLVFAVLFHVAGAGALGLAMAWTAAQAVAFGVSLHGFLKYARPTELLAALRRSGLDTRVARFAIPQSLSVTFQRFAAGMDLLMLGMLGFGPAVTGVYAVALQVVENAVNTIRFVFTNVFNPWVPRLRATGEHEELSTLFTQSATQSTLAATAVVVALVLFEPAVMRMFIADYTPMPATFAWMLAAPWLLSLFGLAGSVVVLSGHSRLNLFNAITVASANAALNLLLIPRWGALGAAIATTFGMGLLCALQLYQAARLERVRLDWARYAAPALTSSALFLTATCYRYSQFEAVPVSFAFLALVVATLSVIYKRSAKPTPVSLTQR